MKRLFAVILFVGVWAFSSCGTGGQSSVSNAGNRDIRLTITTEKLPTGIVGGDYSARLTATGGVAPYQWSIIGGVLPRGLVLDGKTGELSGTPTQYVKTTVVLRAEDSSPAEHQEATATLPVRIDPDRLTVLNSELPQAIIGMPYSVTLEAAGGTEPYTWSILEGSLPSGLDLDPLSGVIRGKPTQAGTAMLVIQATDSSIPKATVACVFSPERSVAKALERRWPPGGGPWHAPAIEEN